MTGATLTDGASGHRHRGSGRAPLTVEQIRRPIGIALLAAAVLLILGHLVVQQVEAWAGALFAESLLSTRTYIPDGSASLFIGIGTLEVRGVTVTAECTAAFLLAASFVVGGLSMFVGRPRIARILLAVGLSAAAMFLVNQVRILMIVAAVQAWGFEGDAFEVVHRYVGPLLTLVALGVGGVAFAWAMRLSRVPADASHPTTRNRPGT